MSPGIPPAFLRALRNEVSIDDLIRSHLDVPWKEREGYLRFLCPHCGDFHTATNPKTNLARCFRCRVNLNPIDLVMAAEGCGFLDAVKILTPLLEARRHQMSQQTKPSSETPITETCRKGSLPDRILRKWRLAEKRSGDQRSERRPEPD